MEIRHLRTLVTVADEGSFHRAAERLFLSQPTVSAHVAAIERELGAALLERGRRGALPTAAGERLLPYARRLLALRDEAEEHVRAWGRAYDTRVRLCSSIFVAASVLPAALRMVAEEFPRVEFSLRTAFSGEVLDAVAAGAADLGLSRLPPAGDAVRGRCLMTEPVVAVLPWAWEGLAAAEALAERTLLTHNHPGYWDRVLANLAALGHAPRTMDVRQVEVTKRLVQEGLGWSLLPRSAVAAELAAGVLREVPPPPGLEPPRAGTWALWPADRAPEPAARRVVELLACGADEEG